MALLGVRALRMIEARGGVLETQRTKAMVSRIRTDNDTVAQWVDDEGITDSDVIGHATSEIYRRYENWCEDSNLRPFSRSNMTRKLSNCLGLETSRLRDSTTHERVRIYVKAS